MVYSDLSSRVYKLKYSGFAHSTFNAAIKLKNLSYSKAAIKAKIILKILKSKNRNKFEIE